MTAGDDRPTAPERQSSSGGGSPLGSMMFIVMAAIVAISVAALGAIAVAALVRQPAASAAAAESTTLNLTLTEFSIEGQTTAPAGDVVLNVSNEGSMEHNIYVKELDLRTPMLGAGGSASLDLGDLKPGDYTIICEVAGHEASGMKTTLTVTDGAAPAATGDGSSMAGMDHGSGTAMDGDAMDQIMIDSMKVYPVKSEGEGNQILEPKILPDGTKQFELTAAITKWEKRPGEVVDAWSYNGQVPGPRIKVALGDKVEVIVHNNTPMGTDVHWHGIHVPDSQDGVTPITQDPIKSGDTYTYKFTADQPAIGMYHAHMHSQVSVPNGMFGTFVVGENPYPYGKTISGVTIPADLKPVVDMPMVLNDAGVIGLTLNAKSFPATAPLVLNQGDWAAVTYYNEGLTAHPMHLHGFPQLVYAKDGIPLDAPYWADTINIAPGERFSVLFQATDVGKWVWHCHILTHVESESGMFGMATAVVVNAPK